MNVRKHGRTLILRLASRPTKKHARHSTRNHHAQSLPSARYQR
jgi:hypothetical protein